MSSTALTRPSFQGTTANVNNADGTPISTKMVTGMVVTDSPMMFRNRIINGDMRIDQRNAGAAQTITANANAAYCLDRWTVYSATSNATVQRVAGNGSNQYALRITGAASSAYQAPLINDSGMHGFSIRFSGGTLSTARGNAVYMIGHWTVNAEL